jgi:hypothetical protein
MKHIRFQTRHLLQGDLRLFDLAELLQYEACEHKPRRLWCKFLKWLLLRYVLASFYVASAAVHMAGADFV